MREIKYKIYSFIYRGLKVILGREVLRVNYKFVDAPTDKSLLSLNDSTRLNDLDFFDAKKLSKSDYYPVENLVDSASCSLFETSYRQNGGKVVKSDNLSYFDAASLWDFFISNSRIPEGFKNSGFHFAGFIGDGIFQWCLPSWIWTNAAIVRYYLEVGRVVDAESLGQLFLNRQHESGGWVVRYDYTEDQVIPVLAPNDSAYIANHCMLKLYEVSGNASYLKSACKCADWIMKSSREDGLVWTGFNLESGKWLKKYTIVDTSFTITLFCTLYNVTRNNLYLDFIKNFANIFIEKFYDYNFGGFTTSIDQKDRKIGGFFARGQAWALEGLIPLYNITKDEEIQRVIELTIITLRSKQLKNGAWPYNLAQPLLGEDCKGTSVIAKAISDWDIIAGDFKITVEKAMDWCRRNTSVEGPSKGGIFAFSSEGAIVHNNYTSTAFVYSSVYAYELFKKYYT